MTNKYPPILILWGKKISAVSLCLLLFLANILLVDWLFANPFPNWLTITCGISFIPVFCGMILWLVGLIWQRCSQ